MNIKIFVSSLLLCMNEKISFKCFVKLICVCAALQEITIFVLYKHMNIQANCSRY
jgi:hypothetical protein